jgi:hypothetical protein
VRQPTQNSKEPQNANQIFRIAAQGARGSHQNPVLTALSGDRSGFGTLQTNGLMRADKLIKPKRSFSSFFKPKSSSNTNIFNVARDAYARRNMKPLLTTGSEMPRIDISSFDSSPVFKQSPPPVHGNTYFSYSPGEDRGFADYHAAADKDGNGYKMNYKPFIAYPDGSAIQDREFAKYSTGLGHLKDYS